MAQTTRSLSDARAQENRPAPRETLRQLRHLTALSEHSNYHIAAEVLGITQAALTQSIQKLEEHYGVPLFERSTAGVRITECGSIVADAARETLAKLTDVRQEVRIAHRLEMPKIDIGCSPLLSEVIVAPALASPRLYRSGFAYSLEVGDWDTMQRRLLSREVDVYLGFVECQGDSKVAVERYAPMTWHAFFRQGHPLAGQSVLSFDRICGFPLVIPNLSRPMLLWMREHYVNGGDNRQARLPTFVQTSDHSVIRHIVARTDAISLAISPASFADADRGLFGSAEIPELPKASCALVTRKRSSSSLGSDALLSVIRQRLRSLPSLHGPFDKHDAKHTESIRLREVTAAL